MKQQLRAQVLARLAADRLRRCGPASCGGARTSGRAGRRSGRPNRRRARRTRPAATGGGRTPRRRSSSDERLLHLLHDAHHRHHQDPRLERGVAAHGAGEDVERHRPVRARRTRPTAGRSAPRRSGPRRACPAPSRRAARRRAVRSISSTAGVDVDRGDHRQPDQPALRRPRSTRPASRCRRGCTPAGTSTSFDCASVIPTDG